MKKNHIIYKSVFIVLTTVFLGGCVDLTENPISIVAPEIYFESENDVETAVFGAYTYFYGDDCYGRQFTTLLALLDDICDIIDPGTVVDRRMVNKLDVDPANSMLMPFWRAFYRAIGAANTAAGGVTKITVKDQQRANALEAEARMIRAYCFFELVRLFGDVPYIDEAVSDPSSVANMSRTPVDEIYPKLIEDCLFGIQHLPEKRPNDIRHRPTKGAAKTMLASIYLTLGDYANAAKYAVEVINERNSYGYKLMEDFTMLWDGKATTEDVEEYIWTIDFYGGINDELWGPMTGVRGCVMGNPGVAGWSVVYPSHGYLPMFDPDDHRIEATFILEGNVDINGVSTLVPYTQFPAGAYRVDEPHFGKYRKYVGPGADDEGRRSGRNFNIHRFAEVYLMAAEALAEVNNGPTAEALEYLNEIRKRARFGNAAGPADYPSGMSKTDFINAVLKERMLEFGCEWKRWYDIKRRDLGAEVFGPNTIETDMNAKDGNGQHSSLMWTTKKYLLPIPQADIDRNPNLTQNAGYN